MDSERMQTERYAAEIAAEIDQLCSRFSVPEEDEPSEAVRLNLKWQKDLFELKMKEARCLLQKMENAPAAVAGGEQGFAGTPETFGIPETSINQERAVKEGWHVTRLMLQQAAARAQNEVLWRENLLDRYRIYQEAARQGERIDQTLGMEQERKKLKKNLEQLLNGGPV